MVVHLTTHLEEALIGADFVTTQIRVGQLAARIQDEKIPYDTVCSVRKLRARADL
ncbi:6-phospho-beta-glucosidase [Kluyvera cryocrescens]|uniref:6-phospho-beta-glucosidase n=1 Tax=Kluyvera cryocrescens TaxID=580 RepID=A0A485B5M1_KLUCR|nr:6-phospho-beta-glucosidase [Kluyvera cryocrescens]